MMKQPRTSPTTRGFSRASSLLQTRIRRASEGRGFAESRVLTHWAEIVGEDIASVARPVNVSFAKGGMGATLTVLTTGAQAPMLEMQKDKICERVNACYGYRAISRVRITQTAPTGFSEGRVNFDHAKPAPKVASPEIKAEAQDLARDVASEDLRLALQSLGTHVLNKQKP